MAPLEAGGLNTFFIRQLREDMRDWQGNPLFQQRYSKTIGYDLVPETEWKNSSWDR